MLYDAMIWYVCVYIYIYMYIYIYIYTHSLYFCVMFLCGREGSTPFGGRQNNALIRRRLLSLSLSLSRSLFIHQTYRYVGAVQRNHWTTNTHNTCNTYHMSMQYIILSVWIMTMTLIMITTMTTMTMTTDYNDGYDNWLQWWPRQALTQLVTTDYNNDERFSEAACPFGGPLRRGRRGP